LKIRLIGLKVKLSESEKSTALAVSSTRTERHHNDVADGLKAVAFEVCTPLKNGHAVLLTVQIHLQIP
jgi:hypothetical protein